MINTNVNRESNNGQPAVSCLFPALLAFPEQVSCEPTTAPHNGRSVASASLRHTYRHFHPWVLRLTFCCRFELRHLNILLAAKFGGQFDSSAPNKRQ